jgi:hypothetical protein
VVLVVLRDDRLDGIKSVLRNLPTQQSGRTRDFYILTRLAYTPISVHATLMNSLIIEEGTVTHAAKTVSFLACRGAPQAIQNEGRRGDGPATQPFMSELCCSGRLHWMLQGRKSMPKMPGKLPLALNQRWRENVVVGPGRHCLDRLGKSSWGEGCRSVTRVWQKSLHQKSRGKSRGGRS